MVYLTTYDFGPTACPASGQVELGVHEFDAIGEEEFVSTIYYNPLCPLGTLAPEEDVPGIRECQILGIGRRFLALGVWELNRNGMTASTVSALVIYERVEEASWVSTLILTPGNLSPEYGMGRVGPETMVFGSMALGSKSWLNGFDGENDSGLLFVGSYWDYIQGGWRLKCFNWREPGQGPFGYSNHVAVGI